MKKLIAGAVLLAATATMAQYIVRCRYYVVSEACMCMSDGSIGYCSVEKRICN